MSLPIISELKAIKSKREISYIKRAQKISEEVLHETLTNLKTGITEIKLANLIINCFKQRKVRALAFEPIVAFAISTADIHHEPKNTKLKLGDTVIFDLGCTINSYCSDMTRTFFFGKPTAKQQRVYLAVLEAQQRALQKLSQGERRTKIIDKAARHFLTKKYANKSFTHGLGHGIGTTIHEWPNFKLASKDILKSNMVVTVEPGLYLKNWGGVRIEDMVVITKKGIKNLTTFPKDLKSITLQPK
ncbi:MAG: M24 family metallopeptidase [Patescibacteria group bacterium]